MLLYLIYVARTFQLPVYCLFSLIDRHGRGTLLQNDHAVVVFKDSIVATVPRKRIVGCIANIVQYRLGHASRYLYTRVRGKMGFACKQVMVTRVSLYTKINSIACNCVYAGKNTRV